MSDSVSTSTAGIGGSGNLLRITGMNSGLDVDGIVTKLVAADNTKIDTEKQNLQKLQWKQDAYRTIITSLNTLNDTYLNITNQNSYMLTGNAYSGFSISSSDENAVTATALSGATAGNYNMKVSQIAETANFEGNTLNSEIKITDAANWSNGSIAFSLDGVSGSPGTTINLGSFTSSTPADQIVSSINKQITNTSALNGKVSASLVMDDSGNKFIKFVPTSNTSVKIVSDPEGVTSAESPLSLISTSGSTSLSSLGIANGENLSINYNGNATPINITIDASTKTVSDLISKIGTQSNGQVSAKFDDITGKFTIYTTSTGSDEVLTINNTSSSSLLNGLGLSSFTGTSVQGQDALVTITPPSGSSTTVTQSKNSFNLNGIYYNITQPTTTLDPAGVNLTVTCDPDKVVDKIADFLDKYNAVIDAINKKLAEKPDSNYPPLTDTQKKSMSDDQIQNYNTIAQKGILSNDSVLTNMLYQLRTSFFNSITDVGLSLSQLGMSTSRDITQGGKILITDKTKLEDAIKNNGAQVQQLFMKQSTSYPVYSPNLTSQQFSARYKEEGIFQRVSDIIQQNVGTLPNSSGQRGILLEIAGISGSYTDSNNQLTKEINSENSRIKDMTTKLNDKQKDYYNKFSNLEVQLQMLNSQASWLTQQFG